MGKRHVLFASAAVVAAGIGVGGIATAHGNREAFHVRLRSTNEVAPNNISDPDGRGTADLDINTKTGKVCFTVSFDRTTTPFMGHIHGPADRNTNAPVLVPLFDVSGTPDAPAYDQLERGRFHDCVMTTPTQAQEIVDNPAMYYVNLHNARFPKGAMRGQMG